VRRLLKPLEAIPVDVPGKLHGEPEQLGTDTFTVK
jgi:hypothetical protein